VRSRFYFIGQKKGKKKGKTVGLLLLCFQPKKKNGEIKRAKKMKFIGKKSFEMY
jgi:hypothetical protein